MAALILAGLPTTVLRSVAAFLGLRPVKLASLVNINEKTLERRLKAHARLEPDESERVARLMRIISLAASVLESEARAREWLNRAFDGRGAAQNPGRWNGSGIAVV